MTIRSLSQGMLLSALLLGAFRTGAWGQETPNTTGGHKSSRPRRRHPPAFPISPLPTGSRSIRSTAWGTGSWRPDRPATPSPWP